MRCPDFENLLDAYLDGELSGSLRLEFDAHRLQCSRCQRVVTMLESVGHVVANDRDVPSLSDSFADRVMGQVEGERAPLRLRTTRYEIGIVAVLSAAAVLVFAFLLQQNTPHVGIPLDQPAEAIVVKDVSPADLVRYIHDQVSLAQAGLLADLDQMQQLGGYATRSSLPENAAVAGFGDPLSVVIEMLGAIPEPESESSAELPPNVYPL